jgi:hypothetical protein
VANSVFQKIKDNPVAVVLSIIAGFVLWQLPLGFLQSWSSLEHKTLPEWLVENGWPRLRYLLLVWYGLFLALTGLALVFIIRRSRSGEKSRLDGEIQDWVVMPLTQRDGSPRINIWLRAYIHNAVDCRTGIKNFRLFCDIDGTQYESYYAEDDKLVQTHESGIVQGFKGKEFYNLVDFIRDHKTLTDGEHITGHLHFILPNPKTRSLKGFKGIGLKVTDTWGIDHEIHPKRTPLHPSERIIRPKNDEIVSEKPKVESTAPQSVRALFDSEMTSTPTRPITKQTIWTINFDEVNESIPVTTRVLIEGDANAEFLACYFPASTHAVRAIQIVSDEYQKLVDHWKGFGFTSHPEGQRPVDLEKARFSGRVFIYHETKLSQSDIDQLSVLYRERGLEPVFRGPDYLIAKGTKRESN